MANKKTGLSAAELSMFCGQVALIPKAKRMTPMPISTRPPVAVSRKPAPSMIP